MADDDLAAKVADKLKGLTDALERRYAAATVILRHYLGESFIAECVCLSETPDPFMLNEFDESSDNRFVHMQRVCALADYLFILRDITGFDILLDRIVTRRPLRAPYFEARTASYFRTAGYALTVREERRVKREDFDFQAILNGEKINIEVTACTNAAFSEKNVSNILDEKRKQLPDDAPAAIYCIVPVEWFESYPNLQLGLAGATHNFFRGTQRINYVNYVWDPIIKIDAGAVLAEVTFPIANDRARLKPPNLSHVFKDSDPRARAIRQAIQKGDHDIFANFPIEPSYMELLGANKPPF